MRPIRPILCFFALAFAFGLPVQAADRPIPGKKHSPTVREARKPPISRFSQPDRTQPAELTGQNIYQALLAEIALQRGHVDLASKAYADLALRTRDPKVLERTIEIEGYARRFDLALETARLWLEVEPESKRAEQLMISVMILSNQLDELAPKLIHMLENDPESLADNLLGLNRMLALNPDRLAVFRVIDKTCRAFLGLAEAHYTVALAASSAGIFERAHTEIRRSLELRPDWEMAALLEAQLLMRESPAEAIRFLQSFIERAPKARDAQLLLARALIGERRYTEAKRHFDQLLLEYPDRPEVVYPVAILALQQNDRVLAENQLKHFVSLNVPDKNFAYYYLGQIAEEDQRNGEALAYYSRVANGEQYINATLRRASLLASEGQLDLARKLLHEANTKTQEERIQLLIAEASLLREANQLQAAFDLLDRALSKQPEQTDLLYETAMLAEKLGNLNVLESRLRQLIELSPENAHAYNALGYSLADRNLRLSEARELIEKALALAPNDVFIIDSMGWVLYRQGDLPGALAQLERAHALRDDPEIAAHLGEVLWAQERKAEAQRLLHEAHKKYPKNEPLTDAFKKFVP